MTKEEFRELCRDWFKHEVLARAGDVDRKFAREVGLTATEVNHIVNDKRYPSWEQIAKVTQRYNIQSDAFLLDLVARARKRRDEAILGPPPARKPTLARGGATVILAPSTPQDRSAQHNGGAERRRPKKPTTPAKPPRRG